MFRELNVVVCNCNPSTSEAEAGGSWVQASLGYIMRPGLKLNQPKKQTPPPPPKKKKKKKPTKHST
jgi:hypothetical protein